MPKTPAAPRKPRQVKPRLVLVFQRALLKEIGEFQGYALEVEKYLSAILDRGNNHFMPRKQAEKDFQRKQVIPYVLLRYRDSIFSYVRGKRSGETRLLAKRSIGLGGHVEPEDENMYWSDRDVYLAAAHREVMEEVNIGAEWREHLVGLINDDSNDVGKVHFGIVHVWDLKAPVVTYRERAITKSGFVTPASLQAAHEELEPWSQIALEILKDPGITSYFWE